MTRKGNLIFVEIDKLIESVNKLNNFSSTLQLHIIQVKYTENIVTRLIYVIHLRTKIKRKIILLNKTVKRETLHIFMQLQAKGI